MKPKIFSTLPGYTAGLFAADFTAGVTVAMVALPLSLAIAVASGAPPAAGLVTAVIAGFLISLLGGSRVQIGGSTGAFIVVVFAVIAEHGYEGLVLATLMAGFLLLLAGLFRAGSLIAYVPEAVIDGFTIGIAIIIAVSQLKDFLGLDAAAMPADFIPKLFALYEARETGDLAAAAIGAATMLLIIGVRRVAPASPGPIIAVGLTSAAVAVFDLPVATIASTFGALPDALPAPVLPEISVERLAELLPAAITIAFLAGVESLLSAIVADRMLPGAAHRPNAEVIAQGAANIGSALFGGLPATGAIARTATNVRAGGRTPIAGMIHALALLAVMTTLAPLVGQLALPALAAILIVTAWNMSEPHRWAEHVAAAPPDKYLIVQTLLLTVLIDLTVAIGVGVAVGLALQLKRRKTPPSDWTPRDR